MVDLVLYCQIRSPLYKLTVVGSPGYILYYFNIFIHYCVLWHAHCTLDGSSSAVPPRIFFQCGNPSFDVSSTAQASWQGQGLEVLRGRSAWKRSSTASRRRHTPRQDRARGAMRRHREIRSSEVKRVSTFGVVFALERCNFKGTRIWVDWHQFSVWGHGPDTHCTQRIRCQVGMMRVEVAFWLHWCSPRAFREELN